MGVGAQEPGSVWLVGASHEVHRMGDRGDGNGCSIEAGVETQTERDDLVSEDNEGDLDLVMEHLSTEANHFPQLWTFSLNSVKNFS